jgi:hypothetical protein
VVIVLIDDLSRLSVWLAWGAKRVCVDERRDFRLPRQSSKWLVLADDGLHFMLSNMTASFQIASNLAFEDVTSQWRNRSRLRDLPTQTYSASAGCRRI